MQQEYFGGTVQRGIRLPEDLDEQIRAQAQAFGISYSDMVRVALRKEFPVIVYREVEPGQQSKPFAVTIGKPQDKPPATEKPASKRKAKRNGKHK